MQRITSPYGFGVVLGMPYQEALDKTKAALKEEGFGILTEIDVKNTFKQKLDVDYRNYTILGACNPQLAHSAITAEPGVGLLLPCNVTVYESDGKVVVSVQDPDVIAKITENPALQAVAIEARNRLQRVIERLAQQEQKAA